jgi:translation elongation factor EF-Ts
MLHNIITAQKKQVEACNAIEEKRSEELNNEVTDFWKQVGEECLRPRSTVFESDEHLKGLTSLRTS